MINRPSAQQVFRDYATDGVQSSGPYSPQKSDIRDLFASRGQLPSDFGAVGDTTDATDLTMTLGSKVLNSASGSLANAVQGQAVAVLGAGTNGATLYTTVTDPSGAPTSIVVADAAITAVSNAAGFYGTDDTDALTAWAAADGWLRVDPTSIYTISAPISFPAVIVGQLRLRMTGEITAGQYGFTCAGVPGAAQALTGVAAGATKFTPVNAALFRAGDFFLAASNQVLGLFSACQLAEVGIVESVNGDGSITATEPMKFAYGNFRVGVMKLGNTPGSGYAAGDFLTLVGGTLLGQPAPSVSTAKNTITISMAPPVGATLDHFTGASLQVRSTDTLPAGIAANTNYYCGNVQLAAGQFTCQLFTVQADAVSGTGASLVNISSAGTGTFSVIMPMMIRVRAVSASGAILDWQPVTWGAYSAVPAVPSAFTTSGAGTNAEAQTCTIETCTVTPIAPVVPSLDLEIFGDGSADHRGAFISYAKGGQVRIAGANCGRVIDLESCQDTACDVGNVANISGDAYSCAVAVTGAGKRTRILGGAYRNVMRAVAINPPDPAGHVGIVQDTVVKAASVIGTTTTGASVALTAVDAATGANRLTIAAPLMPGAAVTIVAGGGATLPGGLTANTPVYAGNITHANGAASFQPYTDYEDALNGLSANVVTLSSAGSGSLTATVTEGGSALLLSDGQIGTSLEDVTIVSAAVDAVALDGGSCRIANCSARSPGANGIRLSNATFYPATWKIDESSVNGAGQYGHRINGAAYTRERLQLGRVSSRNANAAGLRTVSGAGAMISLEHSGSVRSDHDAAASVLGCVMLGGLEGGALPEMYIEGVAASGVGLRITGCKGPNVKAGRVAAAGKSVTLVLVEASASHVEIDQIDLYDGGYATVTGIDVSDATITNITVGANCDFHNCATLVSAGASSATNNVGVMAEKTIFANHAGSPYTAPNGRVRYLTDSTAGTITINPNAHPSATDTITIKDDAGTAQTNAVTFGGTVGSNDNAVINRQGDFARYDYSSNQARWSQTI